MGMFLGHQQQMRRPRSRIELHVFSRVHPQGVVWFIDPCVLHLKAEEGLVIDSILGTWGLTFSTPCSNTKILHFTKLLCLQLFKEKKN